MRYGKIYFYDRMGNKLPDDQTSQTQLPETKIGMAKKENLIPETDAFHTERSDEPVMTLEVPQMEDAVPQHDAVAPTEPLKINTDGDSVAPVHSNLLSPYVESVVHDEELCDSCRWREVDFATRAMMTASQKQREFEEENALRNYLYSKESEEEMKERQEREKTKQLNLEIQDFNIKLAEQKRRRQTTDIDPGNYLFLKRPDTATVTREKQRQMFNELNKQVAEKNEKAQREKNEDASGTTRHNFLTQQELDSDAQNDRQRETRKREDYRMALDAQIAVANHMGRKDDLWWAKRDQVRSSNRSTNEKPTMDQSQRLAKQEASVRNLEDFLAKEAKMIEDKRNVDRERRRVVAEQSNRSIAPSIGGRLNLQSNQLSPMEKAANKEIDRKTVEDAWIDAKAKREHQYDLLRHDYGGAVFDQLRKPHRCRKCQKTIKDGHTARDNAIGPDGEPMKYWFDLDRNLMRPLEKVEGNNIMSRHLNADY